MKIRTDFVTNSSSSSFIGIFAKVADKDKAKEAIWDLELEKYVKTGEQVIKEMLYEYFGGYGTHWANAYIDVEEKDIDPNAKYIIWESQDGAHPDSYINTSGEWIEENYSAIGIEDFEEWEQEVYNNITEDKGFTDIQKAFGAGYDG